MTPQKLPTRVGSGVEGGGVSAAQIDVVLGDRDGPIGVVYAQSLASPTPGHSPIVVCSRPGMAVKPATLLVNKAPLAGDDHARVTWGAAHAGVAAGILEGISLGLLSHDEATRSVLIVSAWVDPGVGIVHQDAVFDNNRLALLDALASATAGRPTVTEILDDTGGFYNPFFEP
jgi:5,6,7,8-tetrahydromethanopterin hydro-lyase